MAGETPEVPSPDAMVANSDRTLKTTWMVASGKWGPTPDSSRPMKPAPWAPRGCNDRIRGDPEVGAGGDQHGPDPDRSMGSMPGDRRTRRQYCPSSKAVTR